MRTIPLTQNKVSTIDDRDFALVSKFRWRYDNGYAVRNVKQGGKTRLQSMDRLIMNAPEDSEVDHRDRNGLNNTRQNLRICTHSENMANRGLFKNNTSGYSGVHYYHSKNRYVVKFKKDNIWHYVGCFKSIEDAVLARNAARPLLHGEFGT